MPQRQRYRFEDAPINMHHPHRVTAYQCQPKPATVDADTPHRAEVRARRRPITLKRMNEIAREFWARKENQP